MSYDNTNRGTLGKNHRREKDSHPEYTGQIDIDGVGYWLSAWVKVGSGNEKFFSLSVRPKEAQRPAAPARSNQSGSRDTPRGRTETSFDDMDSDVPF